MLKRTLSYLYLIIGLLLLLVLSWLGYSLIRDQFFLDDDMAYPMVGPLVDKANVEGLALQGVSFSLPDSIPGSDYFMLPLEATTYETPIELDAEYVMDMGNWYGGGYINVLFLNASFQLHQRLLDSIGYIHEIRLPANQEGKPQAPYIIYRISFKDSNDDGFLTFEDAQDLYISDLDGRNLKQLTRGIDVSAYEFVHNFTDLLVLYTERSEETLEHRPKKLGSVKLESGTFQPLKEIFDATQLQEKWLRQRRGR